MEPSSLGLIALGVLLVLIIGGVPIGIALASVGIVGNIILAGWLQTATQLQLIIWELGTNHLLIVLPLFVLMGQLVHQFGIADDLYAAFQRWLGHTRGGLANATVFSSALFGATTGSSVAAVSAVGKMSLPQMRRYGYSDRLSAPSVAAAGVLAILLPPSIPLVFYGVWTETSIGALFMAGVIPGLILAGLFIGLIMLRCTLDPTLGPVAKPASRSDRLWAFARILPVFALLAVVLGGLYQGWFTPTEAGAVGVLAVLALAMLIGRFRCNVLTAALSQATMLSALLFTILLGGMMMSRFLVLTDVTPEFIAWLVAKDPTPVMFLASLVLLYLVLGAFIDTLGMIILTLPFVFPVTQQMGIDPVWFGIFIAMMVELSLITPPVGLNVLVLERAVPDLSLADLFRGIVPFVLVSLLLVALLMAFPQLATWLPQQMQAPGVVSHQ